jgi:hypothetical protein
VSKVTSKNNTGKKVAALATVGGFAALAGIGLVGVSFARRQIAKGLDGLDGFGLDEHVPHELHEQSWDSDDSGANEPSALFV